MPPFIRGLRFKATSTVDLTAPVTGTYAGVLMMEDRRITAGTSHRQLRRRQWPSFTGIIYAPKSTMNYSGNASTSAYTIHGLLSLHMVGTSTINNDYSSLPTGTHQDHGACGVKGGKFAMITDSNAEDGGSTDMLSLRSLSWRRGFFFVHGHTGSEFSRDYCHPKRSPRSGDADITEFDDRG